MDSPSGPLPSLTLRARAFALLGIEGLSLGLCVWAFASWDRLPKLVSSNALDAGQRKVAVLVLLLGAALLLGIGTVLDTKGKEKGPERVSLFAQRAAPAMLLGLVPFLVHWRAWLGQDLTFLVLLTCFSLALRKLLRWSLETLPEDSANPLALPERVRVVFDRKWLPPTLVGAATLFYFVFFTYFTLGNHFNLTTSAFDLGIENNLIFNAMHGGPLFRSTPLGGNFLHGGFHQTWFAYVLTLPYRFIPRAETLLVIQALFLAGAIVPLYLCVQRRLGPWVGVLFAWAYVLYPPLHGANMYDFHYQPFGVFFVLLTLQLVETHRDRWAILSVLLLLSVREDMGFMLAALGGYMVLAGIRPKAGVVLGGIGAAYFVAQKFFIMPHVFLSGQSAFSFIYKDLLPAGEHGFGGVLKSIFTSPGYALTTLLTEKKLVYFLLIFTPLAFLPWRRRLAGVLFLPGFVVTLLSTGYDAATMITFQYSCYWVPMVFLASAEGLSFYEKKAPSVASFRPERFASLVAMVVATLIASQRFGVVFQQETAQGAFDKVHFGHTKRDRERNAQLYELLAQIPPTAKVAASEWLVAHVANRIDAYSLRFGTVDAEYLVFWVTPLRSDEQPIARRALRDEYGVVDQRGVFVLAKRGFPTTKNRDVLRQIR